MAFHKVMQLHCSFDACVVRVRLGNVIRSTVLHYRASSQVTRPAWHMTPTTETLARHQTWTLQLVPTTDSLQ